MIVYSLDGDLTRDIRTSRDLRSESYIRRLISTISVKVIDQNLISN